MPSSRRLLPVAAVVNLSAAALTLALILFLPGLFPAPAGVADPASRLAFAARLSLWPALVLFGMVCGVIVARARSVALNPIDDPESRFYRVAQRTLSNTVEQTLIFLPALAALTVLLPAPDLGAARLLTILFVLGRLLFWAGYLVHPYARAPGMAMTFTVTMVALGWATLLAL